MTDEEVKEQLWRKFRAERELPAVKQQLQERAELLSRLAEALKKDPAGVAFINRAASARLVSDLSAGTIGTRQLVDIDFRSLNLEETARLVDRVKDLERTIAEADQQLRGYRLPG